MRAGYLEEVVRRHSLRHLAEVFGVSEASLSLDARFGQELKANPASDFKANQFDIVDGDIKDVADKRLLPEMRGLGSGLPGRRRPREVPGGRGARAGEV